MSGYFLCFCFFKQKTAYEMRISDWSSDVCSSDLGADASAGTIKSGGKTRRAAKMVILNVDHPDVEEFVWVKAREEKKIRVLEQAGFDMSLDGKDIDRKSTRLNSSH